MALTKADLQKIAVLLDDQFEKRFAEQDRKWEENLEQKFTEKFAENDRKWQETLDRRFAEQDKKWKNILDETLEKTLDKRFAEFTTNLMEVFVTKDYLDVTLKTALDEFRDEFRSRLTTIEDLVIKFHNDWKMGAPPLVERKLHNLDTRVSTLERKVSKVDVQVVS